MLYEEKKKNISPQILEGSQNTICISPFVKEDMDEMSEKQSKLSKGLKPYISTSIWMGNQSDISQ